MATKTANVTARIQPNIKEQAEAILDRLGIPVSVFIDMTYRQVIMRDGVPFSLDIPDKLVTRDSITQAEFDTMMQTGLAQAKKNDSVSVDEAFSQLKSKIQCMNEYEVRVTRQALEQVKEIVHYISNDLMAPDVADNLLDKMKAEITNLSSFPKKHALIDEEPWRTEGVRKIVVKNFLIYYWVDDENNRVQVTAVIYSRRDQTKQLSNMDME